MKNKISKENYRILLGLGYLATEKIKELKLIEKSIAKLVNQPNDGYDYYGHVSDYVYSSDKMTVENLLERLEINVKA